MPDPKSKYMAPDGIMPSESESTSVKKQKEDFFAVPTYLRDRSSMVVAPNGQPVVYLDKSTNKSKTPKPDPVPAPPKTLDHPYASLIESGPMGANKFMEFRKLNDERRAAMTEKQRFDEDLATRQRELDRNPEKYNVMKDYVQKGISEPGLEQVYPVEETLFMMTMPGARAALKEGASLLELAAKESLSTLTGGVSDIAETGVKKIAQASLPSAPTEDFAESALKDVAHKHRLDEFNDELKAVDRADALNDASLYMDRLMEHVGFQMNNGMKSPVSKKQINNSLLDLSKITDYKQSSDPALDLSASKIFSENIPIYQRPVPGSLPFGNKHGGPVGIVDFI